jgi:hypothetical protein
MIDWGSVRIRFAYGIPLDTIIALERHTAEPTPTETALSAAYRAGT